MISAGPSLLAFNVRGSAASFRMKQSSPLMFFSPMQIESVNMLAVVLGSRPCNQRSRSVTLASHTTKPHLDGGVVVSLPEGHGEGADTAPSLCEHRAMVCASKLACRYSQHEPCSPQLQAPHTTCPDSSATARNHPIQQLYQHSCSSPLSSPFRTRKLPFSTFPLHMHS